MAQKETIQRTLARDTRSQVAEAVRAVENKKGEDVVILEMDRNAGAFTDYFILCTGTNSRQIQAISDEVEIDLAQNGIRPNNIEGYNQAEWVLLDYIDFVVHIFSARARAFYDLERLWKSATRLSPANLKKRPATRKKSQAAARARPRASRKARQAAGSKAKARKSRKSR